MQDCFHYRRNQQQEIPDGYLVNPSQIKKPTPTPMTTKTPQEINDEIRNQVNHEDSKPANGFEMDQDELEWEDRTHARFMDLVNKWPKH